MNGEVMWQASDSSLSKDLHDFYQGDPWLRPVNVFYVQSKKRNFFCRCSSTSTRSCCQSSSTDWSQRRCSQSRGTSSPVDEMTRDPRLPSRPTNREFRSVAFSFQFSLHIQPPVSGNKYETKPTTFYGLTKVIYSFEWYNWSFSSQPIGHTGHMHIVDTSILTLTILNLLCLFF